MASDGSAAADQAQADRLEAIRHQLEILCRRPSARTSEWLRERPTEWTPTQVTNPKSPMQMPFTPSGAWAFVADLLRAGQPLEEVALRKPPGCTAYVVKVDGGKGKPRIYIKLELQGDSVHGRSFHYERPEQDR